MSITNKEKALQYIQDHSDKGIELESTHKYFEELIDKIPFYENMPQMIPVVGKKYCCKKILLVCKSFGISKGFLKSDNPQDILNLEEIHKDPEQWYVTKTQEAQELLNNLHDEGHKENDGTVLGWVDIRYHLGDHPGHVWHIPAGAILNKAGKDKSEENMKEFYKHFALMNFFHRPLRKGKLNDFDYDDAKGDIKFSTEIFQSVVNILQPKSIWVIHKGVYDNIFSGKNSILKKITLPEGTGIEFTNCPLHSRGYWPGEGRNGHGENKFIKLINERCPEVMTTIKAI